MRSMRVVLVNAPLSLREMYGGMAKVGNTMPALGLCHLASYLRQRGVNPMIIDAVACRVGTGEVLSEIQKANADIIGISCTTIGITAAEELARSVKKSLPRAVIILGGAHVTAIPRETFQRFPSFDIGVLGEGEAVFWDLLCALERGEDISSVEGIVFRKHGEIVVNKRARFIEELDTLPVPAWDLLPGFPRAYSPPAHSFRRFPIATMVTSRGCPFQCNFCDRSVFGERVRLHSWRYVLDSLKYLVDRFGVREIIFYDDNFTIDRKRILSLCEGILAEDLDITWSCFCRIDQIDEPLLRMMERAGCWQIGYGIESGVQRLLDLIKKKINLVKAKEVLRLTREAGISTKGFFIIGNFGETEETIKETIRFALTASLDDFQITNFTPFPNTEAYRDAHQYGQLIDDWSAMNMLKVSFIPKGLTARQLLRYQKKALWRFYSRPKIILKNLFLIFKYPRILLKLYRGGNALIKSLLQK